MGEEGAEIDLAVLRVAEARDLVLPGWRLLRGGLRLRLRACQRRRDAGERNDQLAKRRFHARPCSRRRQCGSISPSTHRLWRGNGAGDGNRTHVSSLGSYSSTIELHPRRGAARIAEPSRASQPRRMNHSKPLIVMALPQESRGQLERAGAEVLYTGVGKVNAAASLARRLAELRCTGNSPGLVVNLGTAGSRSVAAHSLVACNRFAQRDMDVSGLGFARGRHSFRCDSGDDRISAGVRATAATHLLHCGLVRHASARGRWRCRGHGSLCAGARVHGRTGFHSPAPSTSPMAPTATRRRTGKPRWRPRRAASPRCIQRWTSS